jgi:aldehyde dehydrogenase (NAD+)
MTSEVLAQTAKSTHRYDRFELQPIGTALRHGSSQRTLKDLDPFTGDTLVEIPMATAQDLDEAYSSAEAAATSWANASPSARASVMRKAGEILEQRKEEVISWLIHESGSTLIKATFEWQNAQEHLFEAATLPSRAHGQILTTDVPNKESRAYRQPLGVVGVISPWNFPLVLTVRSVAPALAVGNAVVVKPASDTPVTGGLLLARVLEEAGLPKGVLSVVIGAGSEIGDYFVEHKVPKLISFTGSTEIGQRIGALATGGRYLKRVALELGGNAPFVVLDDADIDLAVKAAVVGKFLHQGQICMAINRIIVDEPLYDSFCERFIDAVRRLPYGDPSKAETAVGPVINRKQLETLVSQIATAKTEGAKLVLSGDPQGLVLPPHVFTGVTPEMSLAQEESFGPLAPIIQAHGEEDALAIANDTQYGLSAAVFTSDLERGNRFAQKIDAGMTHVNDIPVQIDVNAPFGGEKNSGLGRFGGEWAIEEFTRMHWITIQHQPRQYPF